MSKIRLLHDKLVGREISCLELTEIYLKASKRENDKLNSYSLATDDAAFATAASIDKRLASGEDISLLGGIPMALKANISTRGIETDCCSKMLEGYKPIFDATVWERLKSEGAVLLGKTNMDEFAMGSSSETSCHGTVSNPYDLSKVAGGSSGGSAAAVAANTAVYALGSDTGGSIRQPASFCGLVGLKPTYGGVSRYGLIAYASSFDTVAPIATDCEDCAIVFDAISGKDAKDSTSTDSKRVLPTLKDGVKGMKIGVPSEFFIGLTGGVAAAVEEAIKAYRSFGAEIVPVNLPMLKYALPVYYILACAEASSNLGRYDGIRYGYRSEGEKTVHEAVCKTRSEGFGAEVKRRILLGTYVLSAGYYDAYYKKAQNLRGSIISDFNSCFEKCDILLTPTVPTTAFQKGFTKTDAVRTYTTDICTVSANIAGLPAVSIPCGFDADGMPVGMQLIGRTFAESTIMRAAFAFEYGTDRAFVKNSNMGVQV